MVLELRIWGPAFGLPSIEPECIATVAYCHCVIPEGQWSLIAGHNPSVGASGILKLFPFTQMCLMHDQRACPYFSTTVLQQQQGSKILSHTFEIILPSPMTPMLILQVGSRLTESRQYPSAGGLSKD
jgi:hypothetical protein